MRGTPSEKRPSTSTTALVHHGIELDDAEQRRRHLILSLLADGLDAALYRQKFQRDADDDFPELQHLVDAGLAVHSDARPGRA